MRRQQVSKPRPLFEAKPTCQSLLFCGGRQGKTCLLAPVTRTVKGCWSAMLPRGLEGASIVCGDLYKKSGLSFPDVCRTLESANGCA
jgi:hypothetical protein